MTRRNNRLIWYSRAGMTKRSYDSKWLDVKLRFVSICAEQEPTCCNETSLRASRKTCHNRHESTMTTAQFSKPSSRRPDDHIIFEKLCCIPPLFTAEYHSAMTFIVQLNGQTSSLQYRSIHPRLCRNITTLRRLRYGPWLFHPRCLSQSVPEVLLESFGMIQAQSFGLTLQGRIPR